MINRNTKIVPQRLVEAREINLLTQTELASKLGVSRQAISDYEKGKIVPRGEVLIQLIRVLNIPIGYLTSDRFRSVNNHASTPNFFRKFSSATLRGRKQAFRKQEWIYDLFLYIQERGVSFPQANIPVINKDFEDLSNPDIETIALGLRRHWKLGNGPIPNLLRLLENNGIIVSKLNIDAKLDAFSCWNFDRPFVFLGAGKTAVRSRFDAAHELAHIILHRSATEDDLEDPKKLSRIESQADHFAGAFLLPSKTFPQELANLSLEWLIELKRKWLVSIAAIAYRGRELELITENQMLYVLRQLSARNGQRSRKREPLDNDIEPEAPVLLSRSINLLIERSVKAGADICRELSISPEDLAEITDISRDTFAYNTEEVPVDLIFPEDEGKQELLFGN